jgi:hypothetical protein
MTARARLGADIAGGAWGWLFERCHRRSSGHGGFSGGRLERPSSAAARVAAARGADDGALGQGPGTPARLTSTPRGQPAPQQQAGDHGQRYRGDEQGGVAGPGHGGDDSGDAGGGGAWPRA